MELAEHMSGEMQAAAFQEGAGQEAGFQEGALQAAAGAVIDRLTALAQEHVQARSAIELRWLEDLRAYHGRYDEKTEAALNEPGNERSRAFIKLTRARTDAWESRLSDMLFPVDDDNWGIAPTPVPELTRAAQDAIALARAAADKANMAGAQGMPPDQVQAIVDHGNQAADLHAQVEAELAEAKTRCAAMAVQIKDQLAESQYGKRCRDVIRDACRLGAGILKGPMTGNRPARSWLRGADGAYGLDIEPAQRPEFRRVDPWAFFPDKSATTIEDAEYSFERHLPSASELKAMARKLGFDPAAVRRLVEGRDRSAARIGADGNLNHLANLRAITGEGDAITNRFVMWEYHGSLETGEVAGLLRAAGRIEDAEAIEGGDGQGRADPLDEHRVIAFFCEGELLQLREAYPLDSGESLYSVFSLQPGEASIMGAIGVPRLMYDSQRAMNGAWRMVLDNAALSVGPQIVVDKTQIEPADGSPEISPNKLWWKTGRELGPNSRPFETFNIPLNQAQLGAIIEAAREFADEETSMPMIAQGDQGAHVTQTMGGMAMLMNSANSVLRRVVKNWDDDLTTPSIRRLYDWNMQFGADDAIKGDMKVQARGTSVLLVKELQAQNLLLVAQNWTVHPKLAPMLKGDGYTVPLFAGYSIVSVGAVAMIAWLARGRIARPLLLHIVLAAAINVPLLLLFAFPGEMRNLSLLYPALVLAIASAFDRLTGAPARPRAH
jgi:hypothetical protein